MKKIVTCDRKFILFSDSASNLQATMWNSLSLAPGMPEQRPRPPNNIRHGSPNEPRNKSN